MQQFPENKIYLHYTWPVFATKFREIFQKSKLTYHLGKESEKWLADPNMSYQPQ